MSIDILLPTPNLYQALRENIESLPGEESFAGMNPAEMKQALEGLMNQSLDDLGMPKDALARLDNPSGHDNSDVWDAYVSNMADNDDAAGDSVRDLDATIRELAQNPDGNTQELDNYVAALGSAQPVPGGVSGVLGTQLLNQSMGTLTDMMKSMTDSLDELGELTNTHVRESIDAAANVAARDGSTLGEFNQGIREHFDLPADGGADVEVAIAMAGAGDVIEADAIHDDGDGDVIDAEHDYDAGTDDDHSYPDAIA
jgi:hypothetical protein